MSVDTGADASFWMLSNNVCSSALDLIWFRKSLIKGFLSERGNHKNQPKECRLTKSSVDDRSIYKPDSGIVSKEARARRADRFSSSCFSNSCFTELALTLVVQVMRSGSISWSRPRITGIIIWFLAFLGSCGGAGLLTLKNGIRTETGKSDQH